MCRDGAVLRLRVALCCANVGCSASASAPPHYGVNPQHDARSCGKSAISERTRTIDIRLGNLSALHRKCLLTRNLWDQWRPPVTDLLRSPYISSHLVAPSVRTAGTHMTLTPISSGLSGHSDETCRMLWFAALRRAQWQQPRSLHARFKRRTATRRRTQANQQSWLGTPSCLDRSKTDSLCRTPYPASHPPLERMRTALRSPR